MNIEQMLDRSYLNMYSNAMRRRSTLLAKARETLNKFESIGLIEKFWYTITFRIHPLMKESLQYLEEHDSIKENSAAKHGLYWR